MLQKRLNLAKKYIYAFSTEKRGIMKVSAIQFNPNSFFRVNTSNKEATNKKPNTIEPELVLKQMANLAYSGVNFTGNEFDRTVEENYFQLPTGAKADNFQKAAAQNILLDNDVLVTAPTGTGKTAIAHYAITKNLNDGKKTFYTTPLKALSNEKFRDFQRTYGEDNVGIITGDTKINKDAPIIIMTTEVYRNMVFGDKFQEHNQMLDNLKTVIFDELHYLGDVDRGGIWEQSIFLSKPQTQLLSLSATIGNNKDIAGWMSETKDMEAPEIVTGTNRELRGYKASDLMPIHTVLVDVPQENRHVPLEFHNINLEDITKPQGNNKKSKFSEKINKLSNLAEKKGVIPAYAYTDIVSNLKDEDKLPAIFFVFDKKNSKDILEYLTKYGVKLTNDEERLEIQKTIQRYEDEGKYLGESLDVKALLKGYAVHNSGLLPNQKELVEELFQKKLVKTVIATETLSAGINMPTRTTVITATRKPSSTPDGPDHKRTISPNEFHQMAGRAGRRGIDKIGYCYTLSLNDEQAKVFNSLVTARPNNLRSAFKPSYSFIAKYYDACQNNAMLDIICDKSFYTYNKNEKVAAKNKSALKNMFDRKIALMKEFGYINPSNKLTQKGVLLSHLNGYEQIPIMEMVSSKALANMSPVELAASVSALANIDIKKESPKFNTNKEQNAKSYSYEDAAVGKFVNKLESVLNKYNDFSKSESEKFMPVDVNHDLTRNIYAWAYLNSQDEDSVRNWGKIYYSADKRKYKDEGTLFKGIMMTVDLLKQLRDISAEGARVSKTTSDYNYYVDLYENIDKAISLISKEPAIG